MNARRWHKCVPAIVLVLVAVASARAADSVTRAIREGNELYADGQYTEAINKYNEALVDQPTAIEPKFNKANGYYRLDDLGEAIDLYQEVAAESKDMGLVAKAKYNLGNCLFQRGTKQRDSDLHKALDDMESSITYWRGALDIDPDNEKAARNIEVARLTIKDILDQIKKQEEQQKQQGQQGQKDQQQQQQQNQDQQQQQGQQSKQDQSASQKDPNQSTDPNQTQAAQPKPDPNQAQDQDKQKADQQQSQDQQEQKSQQVMVPDNTAQEILDKEQRQKQQRQIRQRGQASRVEKDW